MTEMLNPEIAQRLREVAYLLAEQGANAYRVQAYQRAADMLERLDTSAARILNEDGLAGLQTLPCIGESLARSIRALITTGRLPMLDRLRGESDPIELLATVPGIGKTLAERLHHDLGIDSLEDLEIAAHDGRLRAMRIGEKKLAGIISSLACRLGRIPGRLRETSGKERAADPSIEELLGVDQEYRDLAAADRLPTIAPRRFNPSHEAWLPVLHAQRGGRHYTALFSNTPRAHRLGRTHDWVILYYDGGDGERQCTIVTGSRGPSKGNRLVRGREEECSAYYAGAKNRRPIRESGPGTTADTSARGR